MTVKNKPKTVKKSEVTTFTVGQAKASQSAYAKSSTCGAKALLRSTYLKKLAISREKRAALARMDARRRRLEDAIGKTTCFPDLSIYGGASNKSKKRKWLCSIDGQIRYREGKYRTLNSELRVFIEGAEVTPYVRGSVSWSIETTGGMNTCSITLNNNHDAFISFNAFRSFRSLDAMLPQRTRGGKR